MPKKPEPAMIHVDELQVHKDFQMRDLGTQQFHVQDIADAIKRGDTVPPPKARDIEGKGIYLTDGFHTRDAYTLIGKKMIPTVVTKGTWADAILDACRANRHAGSPLKRTDADKRNAIRAFLKVTIKAGQDVSDNKIADELGVSVPLVKDVRGEVNYEKKDTTRTGKDGIARKKPRQAPKAIAKGLAEANGVHTEDRSNGVHPESNGVHVGVPSQSPLDGWDIPIQPHAKEAFEAVQKFRELVITVRYCQNLFADLAEMPGGSYLHQPSVSKYKKVKDKESGEKDRFIHPGLEMALKQIEECTPRYTVCPYMFAEKPHAGKKCPLCQGRDWVPIGINLKSIPKACIDKAKEALTPKAEVVGGS